jgi:hypothetical protein
MASMPAPQTVPARHREAINPPPVAVDGPFEVVLRGYDRRQVDLRLREVTDALAAAESAREMLAGEAANAAGRVRELEEQLHNAISALDQQDRSGRHDAQDGFGYRAERILRAADNEASQLRKAAAQEAAVLLERARANAERQRHEAEQQLIRRMAQLDSEAGQRMAAIQEREQAAAATIKNARRDAEEIRATADRSAVALKKDAEAKANEVRLEVDRYAREEKQTAQREVSRLASIAEDTRAELARLHSILGAELDSATDEAEPQKVVPDG